VARPDVLTNATNLVNSRDPTTLDARRANDTLAILTNQDVTLNVPRPDSTSLRVSIYADCCGSTLSPIHKRQLGYLVFLTDASHHFSLQHCASHRPPRGCRGSTAGELLALVDAISASLDELHLLQKLPSVRIPLYAYTDSATAYELVTSFKYSVDMSRKNDLYMLRCALPSGTMHELKHVHGQDNPADALSKPSFARPPPNASLADALRTGRLDTAIEAHTTTDGQRKKPRPGVTLC